MNKNRWTGPSEPTDLAYLAGIVDGEGYITISGVTTKANRGAIRVGVTNTYKPLIDWLLEYGGSVKAKPEGRVGSLGKLPCYHWGVTARLEILALLKSIEPYMRIKRDKAKLAIAMIEEWIAPP